MSFYDYTFGLCIPPLGTKGRRRIWDTWSNRLTGHDMGGWSMGGETNAHTQTRYFGYKIKIKF